MPIWRRVAPTPAEGVRDARPPELTLLPLVRRPPGYVGWHERPTRAPARARHGSTDRLRHDSHRHVDAQRGGQGQHPGRRTGVARRCEPAPGPEAHYAETLGDPRSAQAARSPRPARHADGGRHSAESPAPAPRRPGRAAAGDRAGGGDHDAGLGQLPGPSGPGSPQGGADAAGPVLARRRGFARRLRLRDTRLDDLPAGRLAVRHHVHIERTRRDGRRHQSGKRLDEGAGRHARAQRRQPRPASGGRDQGHQHLDLDGA